MERGVMRPKAKLGLNPNVADSADEVVSRSLSMLKGNYFNRMGAVVRPQDQVPVHRFNVLNRASPSLRTAYTLVSPLRYGARAL
jgi:hypothetical protein